MIKKRYGLLAIMMLMATCISDTSHATYYGGKFPHTKGSVKTIYYTYSSPHRYNGNVWQGAANWRSAAARIKPTPGTSSIKITIADVYQNDNFFGLAWHSPCTTCATYTSAGYYLYQKKMDPLNDFDRTFVATHEFGHTLGLAHTTGTSSSSVMKAGGSNFVFPAYNTPMPYDKSQINALYN